MSPRWKWDSPNPSLTSECAPPGLPPEPGGKAHSPAGEGLGESQLRRTEKKLSTLPTLWRKATPKFLLLTVSKFSGQCSKFSATVEKKFGPCQSYFLLYSSGK